MDWAILALLSVVLIVQLSRLYHERARSLSVEARLDKLGEGLGRLSADVKNLRRSIESRGQVHEPVTDSADQDEEEELDAFGAFDMLEASVRRDESDARAIEEERREHEVGDLQHPGGDSDHSDRQDPHEGQETPS